MKILTVVGNRPQFIKAAAVSGPLRERHEEILVHTGQHYDDSLSRVFFDELGLARPGPRTGDRRREQHLADGAHARRRSSRLLAELAPDAVLVYGDTNSTLAGALAAAQAGVPVVHVEAGMRSFDRSHARGAQPRALRPHERAAAVLLGHGREEPRKPSRSPVASRWSAT